MITDPLVEISKLHRKAYSEPENVSESIEQIRLRIEKVLGRELVTGSKNEAHAELDRLYRYLQDAFEDELVARPVRLPKLLSFGVGIFIVFVTIWVLWGCMVDAMPFEIVSAKQKWKVLRVDRSTEGHPLKVGGEVYPTGLGTHAPSVVRISVPHSGMELRGLVGVDDYFGGQKGSVEFKILGNRRLLWRSGVVRGGDPAVPFRVELDGLSIVELRVTDGGNGMGCDHANWLNLSLTDIGEDRDDPSGPVGIN